MATIDASALPAGYIKIGDQEFGDDVPARCVVKITIKGKRKLDKKAVDGKSDGTTTDKGREPGEIDVELSWKNSDPDVDAAVEEALYQIHPRGPNGGQPQQLAFKRSRLIGADSGEVEEVDGPNDVPGTDMSSAKLKLATWTKPAQTGPGAAKTPTDPTKFPADPSQLKGGSAGTSTPQQRAQAKSFNADTVNNTPGGGAPSVTP